ncbi:MAG: hypothetical protein AAGA48_29975 [Myxococcota bacterium]
MSQDSSNDPTITRHTDDEAPSADTAPTSTQREALLSAIESQLATLRASNDEGDLACLAGVYGGLRALTEPPAPTESLEVQLLRLHQGLVEDAGRAQRLLDQVQIMKRVTERLLQRVQGRPVTDEPAWLDVAHLHFGADDLRLNLSCLSGCPEDIDQVASLFGGDDWTVEFGDPSPSTPAPASLH